jgi:PilZ domain
MNAGTETENKRVAARLRSLKGAHLILPNRIGTFRCMVRNLSATGVCVELPSTLSVPNRVTLRMDDGSPDRLCEVVWRTETRLGLHFLQA